MTITQILEKMIAFSEGNMHDIDHLIRVWTYAHIIADGEDLDANDRFILEAAAIVHDIACPLCREKYGNTNGKHQETEGVGLTHAFFEGSGVDEQAVSRIAFLVGHHHSLENISGMDWQILIEADYIANASENGYSKAQIGRFAEDVAKTASGKRLIREVFCL